MKVVATVALSDFPYWRMCMEKLRTQVDEIHVRIDGTKPNKLDELKESKLADNIYVSNLEWNRWNWRQEMLEMVKDSKPDIVLIPDHDEIYKDGIIEELKEFWASGKDMMFFDFITMTDDNRIIPELNGKPYPSLAHCSAFRWKPELTYFPYCGLAQPTNYANIPDNRFYAKTKIEHYCMWTKELEEEKKVWIIKEYGGF
jgi:hypothetical protein